MRLSRADLSALRYPLLTLAMALLLGAALVLFTRQELHRAGVQRAGQEQALREARERLHQSGEEKEKILRYRAAFIQLQQRGFVGEEQRINWVDALRDASLSLKLFGAGYQIEARQPHGVPQGMDGGPYRMHRSVMKISLGLLHEEDLMRFMHALTERQAGVFTLRECSLQRRGAGKIESAKVQPNLQADCSLAWLSLSEAGEPAR